MKGEIQLSNPILVDNKIVEVLTYDTNEITPALFSMAETKKNEAAAKGTGRAGMLEIDYSFHLYLGCAAVVAVNPHIDMEDLGRLKGADIKEVTKIGRNFIFGKSEEPSTEDDSDDSSEAMHEPSIFPQESSESDV